MDRTLARLADDDMKALEWKALLERAESQWEEFMSILISPAPDDDRLTSLQGGDANGEHGEQRTLA